MEPSGDRDKKGTANEIQREQPGPAPLSPNPEREQLKSFLDDSRAKGFDLQKQASVWTDQFFRGLPQDAQACFLELCEQRCQGVVIAAVSGLLRYSPRLEKITELIAGPRAERASQARKLENAAKALEEVAELNQEVDKEAFAGAGHLHPQDLLLQLRQRAALIAFSRLSEGPHRARKAGVLRFVGSRESCRHRRVGTRHNRHAVHHR